MGFVQLNASDDASLTNLLAQSIKLLPEATDAGYTGYGTIDQGFGAIFIKPNSTVQDFNKTFAEFYNMAHLPGINGTVGAIASTWDGYVEKILQDPNIGTNIQDVSRLLTGDVINKKADELAQFLVKNPGGGFNFSKSQDMILRCNDTNFGAVGKVNNDERDNTAVNDIWKQSHALLSISVDWADNATASEKHEKRLHAVQLSEGLARIVGSEGGTYINEANP